VHYTGPADAQTGADSACEQLRAKDEARLLQIANKPPQFKDRKPTFVKACADSKDHCLIVRL